MKLCDLDEIKVCVDRQYQYCHGYTGSKKTIYREAILAVKSILHSTKLVDAVPVQHGHWIYIKKYGIYECSVCHEVDKDCSDYYSAHIVTEQDYCPCCGAKMDLQE